MAQCHQCGAAIEEPIRVRDVCPSCHAYLHCCLNCKLYSPGAHNHCLSPTTEHVGDAAAGNFCDEFELAKVKRQIGAPPEAKSRFDKLFGD
jgi:hypothetical protein